MNHEQFWKARADKLRRFKGLCPLTPEEADQALRKIKPRQASDKEIDSIVNAIASGDLPETEDQPEVDWSPDCNYAEIDSDAILFRNEGEGASETDAIEDELLEELLDDDEQDDTDDVEG